LLELLDLADRAPSVGLSQPWRFVWVKDQDRRRQVILSFKRCNADALKDCVGARGEHYARLKLEGLGEAPVHLAVFVDEGTGKGKGLGRRTMPETVHYSTVMAIHTFWLAARASGLGVGWVSILDPNEVTRALDIPESWSLVAYLCVGWPMEQHPDPELERAGWEKRGDSREYLVVR
jgi:5,6-dimethylbenzimidazole synthase